ncbi:MAG: response regulator transcription factor [Rhodobacterales bacterium]|nr:response regulator transcription factor [Rhodobacterales bacterium]MDX5499118.1 response regulator transcription factor [Rhodobacterales bacterium]
MRVLMIEDALDLAETVIARLGKAGIVCDHAATIEGAQDACAVQVYDAMVIDINLPDGSGLTFLRGLRAGGTRTPVIMLTALGSVDDRVTALDLGADDYLVKPFDQRELEARLRALVRREAEDRSDQIALGPLVYYPSQKRAALAGNWLTLTLREATLLETLLRNKGQTLSKQRLYDSLFGFEDADVGENAIELYIARLRKKLAGGGVSIETRRGIGYRIAQDG